MDVVLSMAECRLAVTAGCDRRLAALARASHEVYGSAAGGDYWTIDVEAAAAELACAKALGVFWSHFDTVEEDRAGDVAPGVQVRHTRRTDGSLIVHDRDPDDHRFVLVVGAMPTFRVVGSIMGAAAKDKAHWRDNVPRPAYFVAQHHLAPLPS